MAERMPMQALLRVGRCRGIIKSSSLSSALFKNTIAFQAVRHRSGNSSRSRSKPVLTKPTNNKIDRRTNKIFVDIVNRAHEKLHHRLSADIPDIDFSPISMLSIRNESSQPIKIGDLIWNGHTVDMVVYVPQKYNDNVLTMNMRGIVSEISWQQIRTRLGPALHNGSIGIPLSSLVVDELTEGEVAFDQRQQADKSRDSTRSPDFVAQEKTYSALQVVGKAVNSQLYLAFSHELRKTQLEIEATVSEWKHAVFDYVRNEVQQLDDTVVVPLFDFADAVKQRIGNKESTPLSPLEYCAVQICLEDDNIQFDVRKSVSCLSPDSLIVYPSHLSTRLLNVQYDPEVSTEYLKCYARGELNHPVSESTAIAELRRRFPDAGTLDPHEATELLRVPDAGMWDKLSYRWLYQTASINRLDPQTLLPDAMASIREEFTHPVYCIDTKNAKVAEDGISVEDTGNPYTFRVGIHVSNPSAFMDLGGSSFLKNVPLVGTILENDRIWRMLPYHFAKSLSLDAKNRPSLSVFAEVNIETGEVSNCVIKAMKLTNIRNLTIDELNNEQLLFKKLWKIAEWRVVTRFNRGAFNIDNYEDLSLLKNLDLSPKKPWELPLIKPTADLSHSVLQEFMLFANELVGEFCKRHEIPILYRIRNMLLPSDSIAQEFERERVTNNGFVGAQWRKVVVGTRLSTTPGGFVDCGASVYTRFTSPLRRLEDLLVHHQIQGYLTKNLAAPAPQFSQYELDGIKDQLEVGQQVVQSLFRDVSYLKKFNQAAIQPGMKVPGIVVKNMEENKLASIYLLDSEFYADYTGEKLLPIGHTQNFTISRVMSFARKVHLQ